MFHGGVFRLVGVEVLPYKTHPHAARKVRGSGERVDVPLERFDRALLDEATSQSSSSSYS